MDLLLTNFRSDINHNIDPFAQQENDEVIQQEVQPQLDTNESSVSNPLPAVDFLIGNGEVSVIDTDDKITQLN